MPICYYPSRPGTGGRPPADQYAYDHNNVHTDDHCAPGDFHEFIEDPRYDDPARPVRDGEFLLIAPGADRRYFTQDDVVNYARGGGV
jgi:hypothetical protein